MESEIHMTQRRPLRTAMAASGLALLLAAGPALAQPADHPGRGQGAAQGQGQGASQGQGQGASQGQGQAASQGQGGAQQRRDQAQPAQGAGRQSERESYRDRERRGADWRDRERRDDDYWRDRDRRDGDYRRERDRRDDSYRRGPRLDERELRRVFGERHDWVREDDRAGLPPGIRMNLERGKPLPPGIAQRFDDRSLRDLPRYDGYEWRRVGPDAVLVDIANDIVYEILRDVLY
jgi:hypothetical protein